LEGEKRETDTRLRGHKWRMPRRIVHRDRSVNFKPPRKRKSFGERLKLPQPQGPTRKSADSHDRQEKKEEVGGRAPYKPRKRGKRDRKAICFSRGQ